MNKRLTYNEFFPPREGQGLYWYWKARLTEFPKVIKAKYQRATRGWADCDVWNIDIWFQGVVPNMLRRLSENGYGFPGDFSHLGEEDGAKYWRTILTGMADDLEALHRYNERWFGDAGLYSVNSRGEQTRKCYQDEQEASRVVLRGLFEFYTWFFHLWD